ncbi:MAG: helix-turn-helix transcriptional regulator [Sphingomonas sp.]|nr:helix-turn-helix transcriptional regulator [Sphingomonas sp.]
MLDNLCDSFGAMGAGIVSSEDAASKMLHCARPTSRAAQEAYAGHFCHFDPIPRAVLENRQDSVGSLHCLLPRSAALDNPMIVDWAIPNGMGQALYYRLENADHRLAWLCLAFPFDRRASDMDRLAGSLLPCARILSIAFEMKSRLERTEMRNGFWSRLFENIPVAVIAVDKQLRVVDANQAAAGLNYQTHGLAIHGGHLTCLRSGDTHRVRAISGAVIDEQRPGGWLTISPDDRTMIIDIVIPPDLARHDDRKTALLIVREQRALDSRDVDRFACYYGLTGAEARVARGVGEGRSLTALAAELGVSHATARAHLQHIFDKCGLHSQSALAAHMHQLRYLI